MYAFQMSLRGIPSWNQQIISDKASEITHRFSYVDDLVAACIVTQVKIMSSIRLSSDRPNIRLKLPTTPDFIHELYTQTARRVYENPFVMEEPVRLDEIIGQALERTVRKMIPFKDVLSAYLASGGGDGGTNGPVPRMVESSSSDEFQRQRRDDTSSSSSEEEESDEDSDQDEIHVPMQPSAVAPPQQPELMPSHAVPSHAVPSQAMPSQALPSQALPPQAMPSQALPSQAMQPQTLQPADPTPPPHAAAMPSMLPQSLVAGTGVRGTL